MGDDGVEPTELAGVAQAQTESVHAWALDDGDDEEHARRFTPRRITSAALASCLVLIAAAGAVELLAIRGVWHIESGPAIVAVPSPVSSPTPTTVVVAEHHPPGPWFTPTKPVTVTVQAPPQTIEASAPVEAPPPEGITVEQLAAYDRQLVANLQARGWTIGNPLSITQNAHKVCALLAQGQSPQSVSQSLVTNGIMNPAAAQSFVTTATLTYPSCP
jgi:hypothetical protein